MAYRRPDLPMSGRCAPVYFCGALHIANGCGNR